MSRLELWKMSGAGNDFVVLGEEEAGRLPDDFSGWVHRVCRRGLSVGADGVLLVAAAGRDRVRVRFHNPDGSEAFCGNGSRCAARYAALRGLAGPEMTLVTAAGDVPAAIEDAVVRLTLGAPRDLGEVNVEADRGHVRGRFVHAGVPHVVTEIDTSIASAPLSEWGPVVRNAARFAPEGTNFDLVRRVSDEEIELRTWERGVERETLACGSGAVAAAYAARLAGAAETIRVIPASGVPLTVRLPGEPGRPDAAWLTGDARVVFRGVLDPEATLGFS